MTKKRSSFLALRRGAGGPTALLALLIGASACGGGGGGNPPVETPPDMATPPDLTPEYPPGPYGENGDVGVILPNFTFKGYYSPTKTTGLAKEEPFGDIDFKKLHQSGKKYAIIQLAAFW